MKFCDILEQLSKISDNLNSNFYKPYNLEYYCYVLQNMSIYCRYRYFMSILVETNLFQLEKMTKSIILHIYFLAERDKCKTKIIFIKFLFKISQ